MRSPFGRKVKRRGTNKVQSKGRRDRRERDERGVGNLVGIEALGPTAWLDKRKKNLP